MKGIVFTKPKFLKNLFRRNRPKFDIRKNAMFLLLCLFLLVGVILGVICARNGDKSLIEKLDFLFLTDFENKRNMGLFSVFSASFASGFLLLLATFLLGISSWGFLSCLPYRYLKALVLEFQQAICMPHTVRQEFSIIFLLYFRERLFQPWF